jgi:hypothetical protein
MEINVSNDHISNDGISNLPVRQVSDADDAIISNPSAVDGPISTDDYTTPVGDVPPIESPMEEEEEPIPEAETERHPDPTPNGDGAPVLAEERREMTAVFPGLVDLVLDDNGTIGFLMKNPEGFYFTPKEASADGSKVYIPPSRNQLLWDLVPVERVYQHYRAADAPGWDAALFDALLDYYHRVSELPAEGYYILLAADTMLGYLIEKASYAPIIAFVGGPDRGKSRTAKAMTRVGYRGVTINSLREAHVIRLSERFRGLISFDVMDIWKKAGKSADVILDRYERGKLIPRVYKPSLATFGDTQYFDVFGNTIIVSNFLPPEVLATRCVEINMPVATRAFPEEGIRETAMELKARLTAFRAKYMDCALPDVPVPSSNRLGDIIKPLLQIIRLVRPDKEGDFLALVREIERSRLIDRADTFEARMIRAIIGNQSKVAHGSLPVEAITEALNDGKKGNFRLTPQKIGRQLKALGFKRGRTPQGCSAIIWDDRLIESLADIYGLTLPPDSPVMPVTGGAAA